MAEAMRLAEMMATAKLVPVALQKSPADCLMVIQQAIRWDMDPFAVAQECSVIQGKLMYSGKLVAAVVNARGNLTDRLSFSYEGEGDNRTITVTGRLQDELSPRTISVRLSEAKTNNKVWQTQPDQQLMYHGTRMWARRHMPELMLGVYSPEEFDEPKKRPLHNPQTGEITESAGGGETPPPDATADAAPLGVGSTGGAALSIEDIAREAAMRGEAVFRTFYKQLTGPAKARIDAMGHELRGILDAVYDPTAADDHDAHLKLVEAFKHGQQAKADGHARRAIPPEYREPDRTREALCWQSGYDGGSMPEFGTEGER
jgi:hypothetical protein